MLSYPLRAKAPVSPEMEQATRYEDIVRCIEAGATGVWIQRHA